MKNKIDEIISIIAIASSNVDSEYLKLKTTYEPSGIVRERVFCYELYHQLRLILGESPELTLNGEIDKRGHKDFKEEDRKNPDFVFHIPGEFEGNTVVCEVKGNLDSEDIIKDFKTISTFISLYQYKAGVFLLYNHSLTEMLTKLGDKFNQFINSEYANCIFIISLPKAHTKAQVINLEQLQRCKSIQ